MHGFAKLVIVSGLIASCSSEAPTPAINKHSYSILSSKCEAAVSKEANVSGDEAEAVSIVRTETGTLTPIMLTGADAPWNCRADRDGRITDIKYSEEG